VEASIPTDRVRSPPNLPVDSPPTGRPGVRSHVLAWPGVRRDAGSAELHCRRWVASRRLSPEPCCKGGKATVLSAPGINSVGDYPRPDGESRFWKSAARTVVAPTIQGLGRDGRRHARGRWPSSRSSRGEENMVARHWGGARPPPLLRRELRRNVQPGIRARVAPSEWEVVFARILRHRDRFPQRPVHR